MTSTSRSVAALPLRETTQIAPFGRIRVGQLGEWRELGHRIGAEQDDVRVGTGPALGDVGGASGEQRPDRLVVDVDERDPHPRPDPELVEERRGVDPFHRRYRATHAARLRPSLPDLRLRARASADAAAVRAGDRPAAGRRRRRRASRRSPRRTTSCGGATTPRYIEIVQRFSDAPYGGPAAGIGEGGDDPPFAGMHDAAAAVAGGSIRAMEAILRGDDGPRLPPGRRPPPRDAGSSVGVLHLRRPGPRDRPGATRRAARHVHRPRRPPR